MAQQFAGLKSMGYKIAYVDDVNPLASDFTTDVINMKNKGVNAVDLTGIEWRDAAIFVENANTQNWHPGLIFSEGAVYADQFISRAGGPAATNGIQIGQVYYGLYLGEDAKKVPAVKQFDTYVKKVNPSWDPTSTRSSGGRRPRCSSMRSRRPDRIPPAVRSSHSSRRSPVQRRRALRRLRPGSSDVDVLLLDGRYQERQVRPRVADGRRVRLQREVVQRIRSHGLRPGLRLGCPGVGKR
jgi:hypothetical protein